MSILSRRLEGYAEKYREYVLALKGSPLADPQSVAHFQQVANDLAHAAELLGERRRLPVGIEGSSQA